MTLPENYLYTADHEWILVEGDTVRIGITEFAQSELGELVFVEMPVVGKKLNKGDTLCVVESTKAASDVYCPLKCEIASANQALNSDPTLVNSAPYTEGWLATLSGVSNEDIAGLLTAQQYQQLLDSRK